MAITGAIVLLIALVALGGFFFYRALPGNSGVVVPNSPSNSDTMSNQTGDLDDMQVLYIRVIGEPTEILVREPGGAVLTDTTVRMDQYVTYDRDKLEVTIGDPAAVEIYVNGQPYDVSDRGADYSFSVRASG